MSQNPYSTPVKTSAATATHSHNQSGYRYKALRPLAKILLFTVGIVCLGNLAVSLMETLGEVLFSGFSDPNAELSGPSEEYFLYAMMAVGFSIAPVYIASAVLTAILFYRANANLRSLGVRGLQHRPGWCAGFWFIPIISLFKPYQVAGEIDQFSRPRGSRIATPPIGMWWTFWIVGNILSNIETRLALSGVALGMAGLVLSWVATIATCSAGYLFIQVIFSFTNSQEAMLNSSNEPASPPMPGFDSSN